MNIMNFVRNVRFKTKRQFACVVGCKYEHKVLKETSGRKSKQRNIRQWERWVWVEKRSVYAVQTPYLIWTQYKSYEKVDWTLQNTWKKNVGFKIPWMFIELKTSEQTLNFQTLIFPTSIAHNNWRIHINILAILQKNLISLRLIKLFGTPWNWRLYQYSQCERNN